MADHKNNKPVMDEIEDEPSADESETPPGNGDSGAKADDIIDEVNRLGHQLGAIFKDTWGADDEDDMESEIVDEIRLAGRHVRDLARDVSETKTAQDIKQGASSLGRQAGAGLLAGLKTLNRELDRTRDKPQPQADEEEAPSAAEKDV